MINEYEPLIFIVIFFIYITIWARSSSIITGGQPGGGKCIRQISYQIMGIFNADYNRTYSSIMVIIYYFGAILPILGVFLAFRLNILEYFHIREEYTNILILGALAEISITSLANGFTNEIAKKEGISTFDEIRNIRWIIGISFLPRWSMPLTAALGGFLEETVFRGVFMIVMIDQYHIPIWITITLSVLLFVYHQALQLDTSTQMCIIGLSSMIISLIGAFTVVYTGSILPALLAHTSFIIFYTSRSEIFSKPTYHAMGNYRI